MKSLLLTEALDGLLERWVASGTIPVAKSAGVGRAAMVGAGAALKAGDFLFGLRRDLALAIARGVSLEEALLQVLAREGDTTLGRALPGGLKSAQSRVILADGNVASHVMHAAGFGHAARLKGERVMALAVFGSAAQASGELHGAFNFAAVYKAQTVFLCRGLIGDEVPFEEAKDAWGIPVVSVNGHDALAVHMALSEAREHVLSGEGPLLIDARVSESEAQHIDAARIKSAGGWSTETQAKIRAEVRESLRGARALAESAGPISNTTMLEAVFETRPWFL